MNPDDMIIHPVDLDLKHLKDAGEIPMSWKPTRSAPVPTIRCTALKADGERCTRWSLRGTKVCITHGGTLPNVKEYAAAVVESARLRLLGNADLAVATLQDLTQPGTAEGVRLKAASEILDRVGVRGGFEVAVEVEDKRDSVELLESRLETLRERANSDIMDAEIVEAPRLPDGQDTLFDIDGVE